MQEGETPPAERKIKMMIYCIYHEAMVKANTEPETERVLCHEDFSGEQSDSGDVCCFPSGYTFCPPPEFNIDDLVFENDEVIL